MSIRFIVREKIELSVKREELELVAYRWEDLRKILIIKLRSKRERMRGFAMLLKVNLRREASPLGGKANEDLVSIKS